MVTIDQDQRFLGQKIVVVPRARARDYLAGPVSTSLVVTDAGYFPHAARHRRTRPAPVDELIVIACTAGRAGARPTTAASASSPDRCS